MISYIHRFNTEQEFDAQYNGNNYHEPWVSAINDGNVSYNKNEYETLLSMPLTFEITGSGTIYWKRSGSMASSMTLEITIEYKKNDEDWISITTNSTDGVSIQVVTGDIVQFRGNNNRYAQSSYQYYTFEDTNCGFNVKGNIMSLIDSVNYKTMTTLSSNYTFSHLFYDCYNLRSAKDLILPATTLSSNCYENMFDYCRNLNTAPELPATILANYCYNHMFNVCQSLTTPPKLPATTLADRCYGGMFAQCVNLIQSPELPATNLGWRCYESMFYRCTKLTKMPELPATTLTEGCYCGMFSTCISLVEVSELPATTLIGRCYWEMFEDCTSLVSSPRLPATTLANNCYDSMFKGCTNLTTAPELPATTLADQCYIYMFKNCTKLNYIKCLASNVSVNACVYDWTNGVSSSGTFIKNSSITNWPIGTSGIPEGWTVQDAV